MQLNPLNAITPIDGRYNEKTKKFRDFFSEQALIKFRVLVEIEYFTALTKTQIPTLKDFPKESVKKIKGIYLNFSYNDALSIKEIEKETNHDVKAVEYFIKNKFKELNLNKYLEFIHFGLTSQDINNTAIPLSVKNALNEVYFPELNELLDKFGKNSIKKRKF